MQVRYLIYQEALKLGRKEGRKAGQRMDMDIGRRGGKGQNVISEEARTKD